MVAHLDVPPLTDTVQRSKEIFHIKIYKKNISDIVAKDAVRSLTPHSSAACGDGARACTAVRLYSSARISYMEIEVACEKKQSGAANGPAVIRQSCGSELPE